MVLTLLYIGLVLLIAKYIRDGRNWARWLYVFIAFLVAGDVLRVAGFFTGDNLLFRLLSGLTGVAATVAVVLLFLPSSSAYFRPAAGSARPLFGGLGAARGKTGRPVAAQAPVSLDKPVSSRGKRAAAARPDGADRPTPRPKSRKQVAE